MFGRKRIAELEAENARLREGLRFYAARGNWKRVATHAKGMPKRFRPSEIVKDHGRAAAAALNGRPLPSYPVTVPASLPAED